MSTAILHTTIASLFITALSPSHCSQDCPHWKAIVESPGFQRYVLAAADSAHLDIGVPKSFDHDDILLFNQFLIRTGIPVRSFTRSTGFCSDYHCMKVKNDRRALLLVICRSSHWKVLSDGSTNPYVFYLCAIAANYRNVTNFNAEQISLRHHYASRIRGSGVFNFTVNGGDILVTENDEEQRISPPHWSDVTQLQRKDIPLAGAHVTVRCLYPYICEDPAFEMLGEVVGRKNASFQAFEFGMNRGSIYIAAFETHLYPAAMLYFPTFLLSGSMFPGTMVPCYYSEWGYTFFVPGLKPYSKEMVLILPFSLPTWLLLMSCFVGCLLITLLIQRVLGGSPNAAPMHPFVATLVNQSFFMSSRVTQHQSFRLLLGVWIIATSVITVGFRSQLTSFLNDVPLEGKLLEFTSFDDLKSLGIRICVLSYAEQILIPGMSADKNVKVGEACFHSSGRIRIRGDGRDSFLVYGSGSKKHEMLKSQLLSRGYVKTTAKIMTYTGGPEIRTTSPYRKAIGKLLSQTFEGGLFDQAARRAVFRYSPQHEADPSSSGTSEEPLSVSSLQPYFFVWALGISISTTVFLAEYLIHRYSRSKVSLLRP